MKPDFKHKISTDTPHKVKELRLENGSLHKVPIQLKDFSRVKLLNLFNNRLTELLINMTVLENLNLK